MEDIKVWTKIEIMSLCALVVSIIGIIITTIINKVIIEKFIVDYLLLSIIIGIIILFIWTLLLFLINKRKIMNFIKSRQKSLSEKYLLKHYKNYEGVDIIIKDPINHLTIINNTNTELTNNLKIKEEVITKYNTFDKDKLVFKIDDIFFENKKNQLIINIRILYNNYNNLITPLKLSKINLIINEFTIEEYITDIFNIDNSYGYVNNNSYLQFKINIADEKTMNANDLTLTKIESYFPSEYKTKNNYSKQPHNIKVEFFREGNYFKEIIENKPIRFVVNQ